MITRILKLLCALIYLKKYTLHNLPWSSTSRCLVIQQIKSEPRLKFQQTGLKHLHTYECSNP